MYYLTITPHLHTSSGDRIILGSVCYEVSEEAVSLNPTDYPNTRETYTPHTYMDFPIANQSLNNTRIEFHCKVSNEATPRPVPVTSMTWLDEAEVDNEMRQRDTTK